jgi:hypothetical protein
MQQTLLDRIGGGTALGNLGGRLVGVVPLGDDEALAFLLEILTQLDVPVGEFTDPPARSDASGAARPTPAPSLAAGPAPLDSSTLALRARFAGIPATAAASPVLTPGAGTRSVTDKIKLSWRGASPGQRAGCPRGRRCSRRGSQR